MSLNSIGKSTVKPTTKPKMFSYEDSLEAKSDFVLAHRATKHPFLERYAEQGLTKVQTQQCFLEFYQFINQYPFYLAVLGGRIEDLKTLQEISRILADEIGTANGHRPHLDIYREFLNDIGLSDAEIDAYKPLGTSTAIQALVRETYTLESVSQGVGVLFGLETMASDMMFYLNEGLRASGYGDKERFFFAIHVELEKEHRAESFVAAGPLLDNPEAYAKNWQGFETGLDTFMQALDDFWSGIEAKCNPSENCIN